MSDRGSVAWELAAIGAATAVFVASFQVRPPYVDFALAGAAVALIVLSAGRSRRLWALAGPAAASGPQAWRAVLAFTGLALATLAVVGVFMARYAAPSPLERFTNWHMLAAAALYLPWALLQQYIFQFYLFGRWLRVVPLPMAVALTAASFAAVHFPRWPVMAVTFVAGGVWALAYLRWRRLLPLAISHALLGTALHYWVFGNDLLQRWSPLLARWLPQP